MNTRNLIFIVVIFFVLSLAFNAYLLTKVNRMEQFLANAVTHEVKEEEYELAPLMANFQRYSEKLYFAGKNKNWDLADFYLEELEETAENVIKSKVVDDGINVSVQIQEMLLPKIKELQQRVKQKNEKEFQTSYQAMLMNCNGCHMLTKHGFVKIREPKENFYSQEF
jgi:hypothetical protein